MTQILFHDNIHAHDVMHLKGEYDLYCKGCTEWVVRWLVMLIAMKLLCRKLYVQHFKVYSSKIMFFQAVAISALLGHWDKTGLGKKTWTNEIIIRSVILMCSLNAHGNCFYWLMADAGRLSYYSFNNEWSPALVKGQNILSPNVTIYFLPCYMKFFQM